MTELQDPIAVINSLQARIRQLEGDQLQNVMCVRPDAGLLTAQQALRSLRLHGIIALYVGAATEQDVCEEVRRASANLVDALPEVWFLEQAPISDGAKRELSAAANSGMDRW